MSTKNIKEGDLNETQQKNEEDTRICVKFGNGCFNF